MDEQWKLIPGYGDRYMVSNLGRVSSMINYRIHTLKPGATLRGYLTVSLYDGSIPKKPKSVTVHRLVMEAFGPPADPARPHINHKDLDKTNNRIDNLEWCSPLENNRHAVDNGVSGLKNEKNANSKLSDAQVAEIRQRLANGEIATHFAHEYGVSYRHIYDIGKGKYRNSSQEDQTWQVL